MIVNEIITVTLLPFLFGVTHCLDITNTVFGGSIKAIPAAFGDFNSDELTDLFVIRGNTVDILLSSEEGEPLLQEKGLSCTLPCPVTGVVPGDFNGDAFMDALVTWRCGNEPKIKGTVLWGNLTSMNCSANIMFTTLNEPLAMDYNDDFITDLYGVSEEDQRVFWVFNRNETFTTVKTNLSCSGSKKHLPMRDPHSNAFLDLNTDCIADLFVTSGKTEDSQIFEIWERDENGNSFECKILRPPDVNVVKMGQSLFLDVELEGKIDQLLPIQTDVGAKLFAYSSRTDLWHDLEISLKDASGVVWQWAWLDDDPFQKAITVRGGDYSMDGYPDLLAPLKSPSGAFQTVLLENVPCDTCGNFSRKFSAKWDAFYPHGNNTVAGVFFDVFQDGIMDVILVYKQDGVYSLGAFKNDLDYDVNFIKIMVLSGLRNEATPWVVTRLGKKKRTFGSNLPGPRIWYRTVDQDGKQRAGMSSQIPQSAHFALILPYTTFALGRTPNFVDALDVGFAGKSREWPQIIPNSQVVVIPNPIDSPNRWKVQLFVTPSKVIMLSVAALLGTCIAISLVIGMLHWQERRSDRLERLQGSVRFYFDAM